MTASRTYLDYLTDILSAIDDIALFTEGINDEATFRADRKTAYAVTRALESIGEATKRIPPDVQAQYPQVPWRVMARIATALFTATTRSIKPSCGKPLYVIYHLHASW